MFEELKAKAAEHWETFLPGLWAQLRQEDRLDLALNEAARKAHDQIRTLMDQGLRQDEAEERVLPDLIYLPPETDGLDPETARELAEKRAENRAIYAEQTEE